MFQAGAYTFYFNGTVYPWAKIMPFLTNRRIEWLCLPTKTTLLLIWLLSFTTSSITAQNKTVDKKKFFTDDRLIEMTLVADFKKLMKDKMAKDYKENYQPATITCLFPDSTKVTEQIEI